MKNTMPITASPPGMFFETEHDMLDCMHEWQRKLGLSDWFIAGRICPAEDMELEDCAGESEVQFVNKTGLISLLRREELPTDSLLKQPMEQTLIHELLHFLFIGFEVKSREEAVFDIIQHQTIETLAKALYMAKYNLELSWFIAESHKEEI